MGLKKVKIIFRNCVLDENGVFRFKMAPFCLRAAQMLQQGIFKKKKCFFWLPKPGNLHIKYDLVQLSLVDKSLLSNLEGLVFSSGQTRKTKF